MRRVVRGVAARVGSSARSLPKQKTTFLIVEYNCRWEVLTNSRSRSAPAFWVVPQAAIIAQLMANPPICYRSRIRKAKTLWMLWQRTVSVPRGQTLTLEMGVAHSGAIQTRPQPLVHLLLMAR